MPAEPILNLILRNITEAVAGVSEAGQYGETLDTENREEPYNVPSDLKALVQLSPEKPQIVGEETSGDSGFVQWQQKFEIGVSVINAEITGAEPADYRIVRVWSDVVIAVMADRTRDGKAIDTKMGPPDFGTTGFAVELTVDYTTRVDDPTRQD